MLYVFTLKFISILSWEVQRDHSSQNTHVQMSNVWLSSFIGTQVWALYGKLVVNMVNGKKRSTRSTETSPSNMHDVELKERWLPVVGKGCIELERKKRKPTILIDWFSSLKHSAPSWLICVRRCCELISRRGQKVASLSHTHTVIDGLGDAV